MNWWNPINNKVFSETWLEDDKYIYYSPRFNEVFLLSYKKLKPLKKRYIKEVISGVDGLFNFGETEVYYIGKFT